VGLVNGRSLEAVFGSGGGGLPSTISPVGGRCWVGARDCLTGIAVGLPLGRVWFVADRESPPTAFGCVRRRECERWSEQEHWHGWFIWAAVPRGLIVMLIGLSFLIILLYIKMSGMFRREVRAGYKLLGEPEQAKARSCSEVG
jgi:hypothetical protein